METRTTESPADVRHRPGSVERSENPYPIDKQKGCGFRCHAEPHGPRKSSVTRSLLDTSEVVFNRFVRHQDEPSVRVGASDARIRPEKYGIVLRPRGACDQRRSPATEPEQRVLSAGPGDFLEHAVESGVAQNSDVFRLYAQPDEPGSILRGHYSCCGYYPVPRLENRPGGPTKPAAAWAHCARDYCDMYAAPCGSGRKLRPQVQLGEHQEVGFERREQPVQIPVEVVRQVISCVRLDSGGQPCS